MALESEITRRVYVELGLPPQRVLPLHIVRDKIHQELRLRNVQTKLSDQNYGLKVSNGFVPSGRDMPVPQGWNFTPGDEAIVEIRTDEVNNKWDPIEIVNKADLSDYENSGHLAVAFYGNNPARMTFSWDPTVDGDTLRVSYDETVQDPAAPDSRVFIQDDFAPMIGVFVAIDCIDELLGWKGEVWVGKRTDKLIAKAARWDREWDISRFSSPQQGATKRLPFNRNRPGWRSPRRWVR